jgi:hypothetical protein
VAEYAGLAISTGDGRKHCAINKKLSQPDIEIGLGLVVRVVVQCYPTEWGTMVKVKSLVAMR